MVSSKAEHRRNTCAPGDDGPEELLRLPPVTLEGEGREEQYTVHGVPQTGSCREGTDSDDPADIRAVLDMRDRVPRVINQRDVVPHLQPCWMTWLAIRQGPVASHPTGVAKPEAGLRRPCHFFLELCQVLVRLQRVGMKGPNALHNDQLGASHVQFQFVVFSGGFAHTKRVPTRARASAPTAAATSCLPSGNEESSTLTAQPCIEELLVQG